jgi:arylsulfatase A-like enzyme
VLKEGFGSKPQSDEGHGQRGFPMVWHLSACLALVVTVVVWWIWDNSQADSPSVLLITVDTLRADHVGAYGGAIQTPAMDRLARQGVLFDNATSPIPLTIPAHATIFTSTEPRVHGILNNRGRLGSEAVSLAQLMQGAGYRTAAFFSVSLLGESSGLGLGFEVYAGPDGVHEPAEDTVRRAISWLRGRPRDEIFFLWVHLFDPHTPYAPPAPFDAYGLPNLPPIDWDMLEKIAATSGGDISAEVLQHAIGLYRGEVEYADSWIGHLLDHVATMPQSTNMMTVLTADHGECFECGVFFEHSHCLWQAGIRVPLIIRYPAAFRPGSRQSQQVGLLDIAPTILRAAGAIVPESVTGLDLAEKLPEDRLMLLQYPVFSYKGTLKRAMRYRKVNRVANQPLAPIALNVDRVGLVGPAWKYLRDNNNEELFALAPTCSEPNDVSTEHPEVTGRLAALLDKKIERCPLLAPAEERTDPSVEQMLRTLGYLE